MMPRARACAAAKRYSSSAASRTCRGERRADQLLDRVESDVLIVLAGGGLGGRREDRFGQLLRLLQPGRQRDAADRCRWPGSPSSPSRSGSRARPLRSAARCSRLTITARPSSSAQLARVGYARCDSGSAGQMVRHDVRGAARTRTCEICVQHPALARDRIGQHDVERRQPIGRDDQHVIVVDARRCRAPCRDAGASGRVRSVS